MKLHDWLSPEVKAELARPVGRRHQRASGMSEDGAELNCFDPWWIARAKTNANRLARESLEREGFEVWYPQGRMLTAMPNWRLSPKRRNQKSRPVLREDVRLPYGDYIFIRRLFGCYSLLRLFDLNGVGGICMFGETFAKVEDFEIEMLRLAEYDGRFDKCDAVISAKQLQLAEIRKTKAAEDRGIMEPITHTILDPTQQTILFVEAFGRITRTVRGIGDLPATEP